MRTMFRVLLSLVGAIVVLAVVAYIDGMTLPVDHSASVSGMIAAPPAKVFSLITDVAAGPTWRPEVLHVRVLPPDQGRDHWIEDLGHGTTMNFVATRTEPPAPDGHALRAVLLHDPGYGGTWTYDLSPGGSPNETRLHITEAGYIHPPLYRFMMAHIFGLTYNLDRYMAELEAAAIR